MKKVQRFKYEMFVRVRDFGTEHVALFPEDTVGGKAFARVLGAAAKFEEQMKDHVLSRNEARRIKAATRDAVYDHLKTIAAAARRFTRAESVVNPFVMPTRRNLAVVLSTARAFMQAAATRQADFDRVGLPSTFIAEFGGLVDQLQQAADVRLSAKTARSKAQAGINVALAEGLDAARDLDVIVSIATRHTDPATFAAWVTARRVEGQSRGPAAVEAPRPEPVATPKPVTSMPASGELQKAS